MKEKLSKYVIGQQEAVHEVVKVDQMYASGLAEPHRPVGSFLSLGPTGTGKTRTVEATAMALLNNPYAVTKIDCGEFQHSHEIAKLIGSPPGYLGHRETHPLLSQEVINQHHTDNVKLSFILFDEIEKASDALWNLLMGILDKATLTLGDNRKVDFSRALIFMTSNLGASEMSALLAPRLGFNRAHTADNSPVNDDEMARKMSRTGVEAGRRKFTPEFMNRIDRTVVFNPLCESDLARILELELDRVQRRILYSTAKNPFVFTVANADRKFLLSEGIDAKYGARHLKRTVERHCVHPLAGMMASGQIHSGDWVEADYDGELKCLVFRRTASGLDRHAISSLVGDARWGLAVPAKVDNTANANAVMRALGFFDNG